MTPKAHPYVLAIDPGLKYLGWALFVHGKLARCGVSHSKSRKATLGEHARIHVLNIGAKCIMSPPCRQNLHVVVERPKVYPGPRQKGDQNDLIAIAIVGAMVAGAIASNAAFIYPDEWKGQMPKDVCHRRIERRLDSDELKKLDDLPPETAKGKGARHNGLDAVGIGLFAVWRRP